MSLLHQIQRRLASYGIVTHRRHNVRYGSDPMLDLDRLLPSVTTVLDVGANEGQMALSFAEAFPDAHVFAFEPVPATFATLVERTGDTAQIECFDVALGAHEDEITIRLADRSGQNSLLNAVPEPGPDTVTLTVTTGDAWASEHGVEHVDVLKIDTEGYDLNVLSGFEALLAEGKVEAALVECEFDRVRPEPHTSFFDLYDHLMSCGMGFTTLYTDSIHRHQFAWGNALFTRT